MKWVKFFIWMVMFVSTFLILGTAGIGIDDWQYWAMIGMVLLFRLFGYMEDGPRNSE